MDPGFAHRDVLTVNVSLPTPFIHSEWRQSVLFFEDLRQRLEALPGAQSAAGAYHPAFVRGWGVGFLIEGQPDPELGKRRRPTIVRSRRVISKP